MKCNTGIGKLGDNIRGLVSALGYLSVHEDCGDDVRSAISALKALINGASG